jgi:hypothetical protein
MLVADFHAPGILRAKIGAGRAGPGEGPADPSFLARAAAYMGTEMGTGPFPINSKPPPA